MNLHDDARKDAKLRAADFLGMTLGDFERRLILLRGQAQMLLPSRELPRLFNEIRDQENS